MNRTMRALGILCILTIGSLGTTACGDGGTRPFPAIELPGNASPVDSVRRIDNVSVVYGIRNAPHTWNTYSSGFDGEDLDFTLKFPESNWIADMPEWILNGWAQVDDGLQSITPYSGSNELEIQYLDQAGDLLWSFFPEDCVSDEHSHGLISIQNHPGQVDQLAAHEFEEGRVHYIVFRTGWDDAILEIDPDSIFLWFDCSVVPARN